ncbi:MAG: ATP-binding protein [Sulfolobales archaeon]
MKAAKRVKLRFAKGLDITFADREPALEKVFEWAEKGIVNVQVVFGPEGCGKTAWLKQSAVLLRELGFDIIYINPLEREILAEIGVEDIRRRLLEIIRESTRETWLRAVEALIILARELLKAGRSRLAILVDDPFQIIGTGREASIYVKGLLGLIEYPPRSYDVIVAVVATSEGVSRREIGRHRWADILPIWNMSREGFKQLYDQIPGDKPDFEYIWRITGGNPKLLAELYGRGWDVEGLLRDLIDKRRLKAIISSLDPKERELLARAVEDPDSLMRREGIAMMDKLVELNLMVDTLPDRIPLSWIDTPPPERDPVLGIGKHNAWQTPLHREAVRRVLEEL